MGATGTGGEESSGGVSVMGSPSLVSLEGLEAFAERGGRGAGLQFWFNDPLSPESAEILSEKLGPWDADVCGNLGQDPGACMCPWGE